MPWFRALKSPIQRQNFFLFIFFTLFAINSAPNRACRITHGRRIYFSLISSWAQAALGAKSWTNSRPQSTPWSTASARTWEWVGTSWGVGPTSLAPVPGTAQGPASSSGTRWSQLMETYFTFKKETYRPSLRTNWLVDLTVCASK